MSLPTLSTATVLPPTTVNVDSAYTKFVAATAFYQRLSTSTMLRPKGGRRRPLRPIDRDFRNSGGAKKNPGTNVLMKTMFSAQNPG